MKKRNITFGYKIENGQLQLHPTESRIVREIFARYAEGESLKEISQAMTDRQVEFFPGKHNWDKARVMRLLNEQKYLGEGRYPKIIELALFEKAGSRKAGITQNWREPDPDVSFLRPSMICGGCGAPLIRKLDRKKPQLTRWVCKDCSQTVKMTSDSLLEQVFHMLRRMTEEPALVYAEEENCVTSIKAKRLANEIRRKLENGDCSEEELVTLALRCAAENYNGIHSARHISGRLAAMLEKTDPPSAFDRSLFEKTVAHIRLSQGGTVTQELKNGKLLECDTERTEKDGNHIDLPQGNGDPGQDTDGDSRQALAGQDQGGGLLPGILRQG